jgi:hypothetical protein
VHTGVGLPLTRNDRYDQVARIDVRYVGAFKECDQNNCNGPAASRDIAAWYKADLFGSYALRSAAGTTSVTLGVNNVLDRAPPARSTAHPSATTIRPATSSRAGRSTPAWPSSSDPRIPHSGSRNGAVRLISENETPPRTARTRLSPIPRAG